MKKRKSASGAPENPSVLGIEDPLDMAVRSVVVSKEMREELEV